MLLSRSFFFLNLHLPDLGTKFLTKRFNQGLWIMKAGLPVIPEKEAMDGPLNGNLNTLTGHLIEISLRRRFVVLNKVTAPPKTNIVIIAPQKWMVGRLLISYDPFLWKCFLFKGSLYYQPKQGTIKGKSIKTIIHLHCLSPPQMGNFMIPVNFKWTWHSFSQGELVRPTCQEFLPTSSATTLRSLHVRLVAFFVTVEFFVWRLGTKKFGVFFFLGKTYPPSWILSISKKLHVHIFLFAKGEVEVFPTTSGVKIWKQLVGSF